MQEGFTMLRVRQVLVAAALIGLAVPGFAAAAGASETGVDAARVREIAAMLAERPAGVGRPIGDRAAWESAAIRKDMADVVGKAEKLLAKPLPQTSDELFLEYSRNGNRTHWQDLNFERRNRLSTLVLAECMENKGRFLPAFIEALRSISQEQTWMFPAHDPSLSNLKGKVIDIDLGSVAVAWTMATADWLLGDKLPADVRKLIREQLQRRIFTPFKDMVEGRRQENWWLTGTNNWNAVCLAGVTGSALALIEPREERAFFIAAAEKYTKHFLAGIPADGYCTEGVGYWNYGFGNYLMLAETVIQATGGKVDLLQGEHVKRMAMYGLQIEIVPGICPAFADSAVDARPSATLGDYIGRRWGLRVPEGLAEKKSWSDAPLYWAMVFAFPTSVSGKPAPERGELAERTWFDKGGVLICRPGGRSGRLAVALKGGNNAEAHNHNDVGSYVVVLDGQLVLVDPGAEVYTRRTFSEHRYDSKVLSSFGHPVPLVAGKLQREGADARGRVVKTKFTDIRDTLTLDIRSAYDVPTLSKLERTFDYSRGIMTVMDEVEFSKSETFGTALVTFGKWRQLDRGKLLIQDGGAAVEVNIAPSGDELEITSEEIHEDLIAKRTPTRIGINFKQPVTQARIIVAITPAKASIKEREAGEAGK